MKLGRIILVATGLLMPAGVARADMMPLDALHGTVVWAYSDSIEEVEEPTEPTNPANLYSFPSIFDWDLHGVFRPVIRIDVSEPPESPQVLILGEKEGSFTLCLYAIMSLGLIDPVPWTRKWVVRTLPRWYWNGCPGVYRPCLAISVMLRHPEPTAHWDPPPEQPQDAQTCRQPETTVPLWRKSQFTLPVLAARGPPQTS
ncbi:MAG TPA: hypothetical protein VLI39_16445 [Sedimentisphaerales bacterium]|nr:hypothetical protein [Sedimentisphaerales bacterium]